MGDDLILVLPLIATAAFFLKGFTGFGGALIFVPVGALFLQPHAIVVTSSLLNLIAGTILWRGARTERKPWFLLGIGVSMALGTALGVYLLAMIPAEAYKKLLGGIVFILGGWFLFARTRVEPTGLKETLPDHCDHRDVGYCTLAGLSGGLFGVAGPPIIFHFGRQYRKTAFRDLLIIFFMFAAIVRLFSFSVAGLIAREALLYTAVSLPGLAAGLYLGNRFFHRVDEARFSQAIGVALLAIAAMLIS